MKNLLLIFVLLFSTTTVLAQQREAPSAADNATKGNCKVTITAGSRSTSKTSTSKNIATCRRKVNNTSKSVNGSTVKGTYTNRGGKKTKINPNNVRRGGGSRG